MPVYLTRGLRGQTPIFWSCSFFDRQDRATCGGWFAVLHVWRWRFEYHRANPKGWR